ncbi:hypothetical protein ASG65_17985 [Bacillus sp. Leaf13]|nr:hypothetical protein ASG65_17985 [Bacillus sp. Leaf13]
MDKDKKCKDCGHSKCKCDHKKCKDCGHIKCKCNHKKCKDCGHSKCKCDHKKCKDCGHSKCKCDHKKCKDCGHSKCKCESKQEQKAEQNVKVIVNVPTQGPQRAQGAQGPQGPQGPQGAQGPQGPGVPPAFGSLYSSDDDGKLAQEEVPIDFDFPGPVLNVVANPATDSVIILNGGVYEISADVLISTFEGVVQYDIRSNNVIIPGSRFTIFGNDIFNTIITTGKTFQVPLNFGDSITVVPSFVSGSVFYFSASLTVNRIGP